MELQYTFGSISTVKDSFTVKCNDVDILKFNKEDFGGDFSSLYNKSYIITDLDCNDLDSISVVGAEAHTGIFTEELNKEWKEYCFNKIGSKHFSDTTWISKMDKSKEVKVYYQLDNGKTSEITSQTNWNTFRNSIPTSFTKIDFSEIDLTNTGMTSFAVTNAFSTVYSKITKSPKLPSTLKDMSYAFYNCTSLTEAPEIPSSVTNMSYAFYNCVSLTELPEIPSGVTNMVYAFYNCSSLTEIPKIPSGVTSLFDTFKGCTHINDLKYFEVDLANKPFNMSYTFNKLNSILIFNIKSAKCWLHARSSNEALTSGYLNTYYAFGYNENGSTIPKKTYAMPTCLCNSVEYLLGTSSVSSTGYEWWLDYSSSTNEYVKCITQTSIAKTIDYTTMDETADVVFDLENLLVATEGYPCGLKITETTLVDSGTSSATTNCTSASWKITEGKVNTVTVTAKCPTVKDDTVSKFTLSSYVLYTANITLPEDEGGETYEFHGKTYVSVAFTVNLNVDENIPITITKVTETVTNN